jgi:hypothetical protein
VEENIQQPFLEEPNFLIIHPKIKPFHKKILDTIDENTSNAIRIVIDEYYKHKHSLNRDKILLYFCLGMLLVGVATIVNIWYASLIFYGTGVGCIVYGTFYYIENKRNRI